MHDPAQANDHEILAAGAVVWRGTGDARQVCVIHRPRYDDWSLPKGKLDGREQLPTCAYREVAEEAQVGVRLGRPLGEIRYPLDAGDTKVVHWWDAQVVGELRDGADADEVDEIAWLGVEAAMDRLTRDLERDVLRRAVADNRVTTPLIVIRHGKAVDRGDWKGSDVKRPLAARGEKQARALVGLLRAYGVGKVMSSPAVRCTHTVAPYVAASGLAGIDNYPDLTEERGGKHPSKVAASVAAMAEQTVASGVPTAVCGHRPLLPVMLETLGVPARPFATADVVVLHLARDADGEIEVVALEEHPSRR